MQTSQPAGLLGPSRFKDSPIVGSSAQILPTAPRGWQSFAHHRGAGLGFRPGPRLSDRTGAVLASGHSSGGGIDGAAPFTFTVEYESAEHRIAPLEVFEEDVSEGQGYPPPRAVVPVVISADG